jgi:hypothetical protein
MSSLFDMIHHATAIRAGIIPLLRLTEPVWQR